MSLKALSAATQLLLLGMLDPTGLLTFFIEMGMNSLAQYGMVLPMSRSHEAEADETGMLIVAKAGYDPRVATEFLLRLGEAETFLSGSLSKHTKWSDTHPATP